jgi:hypothetical protein
LSSQEDIREKRKQSMVSRIVSEIESGKVVAIAGWMDSNHNCFTKNIPEHLVVFWEKIPKKIPKNVGYVIFTRFVYHKHTEKMSKYVSVHPGVVSLGKIKEALEEGLKIFGGLD